MEGSMKFVQSIGALVAILGLGIAPVFAQKVPSPAPLPPSEQTPAPKIEYILPYPGILPDHPLYTLKLIRDRILDFLIVDPLRKAEFYILQADKRLGMGISLLNKGNVELAEKTVSKGEKYLFQAVERLSVLKNMNKEIPGYVVERLAKAAAKHEEVLRGFIVQATGREQEGLKSSLALVQKMIEEIKKLQ